MKCDICAIELNNAQGTIVPIEEMQQIASNGFTPKKLGIATSMDQVAAGIIATEQMDNAFRQIVFADTNEWLLCEGCHQKTRPFALAARPIPCLSCGNQNKPPALFCGHCGNKLTVVEGISTDSKPKVFMLDSYACFLISGCVCVFDSEQRLVAFHRMKSWNPNIQIFADERETTLLMSIIARGISSLSKMFYDVTQPDGQPIGVLAHNEWKRTWLILTNGDQEQAKIEKPSAIWDVEDGIPVQNSVRTIKALDGHPIATLTTFGNTPWPLPDRGGHCVTQLSAETERIIDRRLVLAYSILSPLLPT